ncbi:MAG: aldehyde oxidase, partial [Comamonadaceae bacterium]
PAEFRRINLVAPDGPGPLGQVVAPFDGPHRALDVAARHPLWQGAHRGNDGRWVRGVGLALVHRSDGFARGGPNAARLALALAPDGAIELRAGFTELGQNLVGSLRSLAARMLGCGEDDVRPVLGDSALTPNSGPVAASRCTTLAWRALVDHGPAWRDAMLALAAATLEMPIGTLRLGQGGVHAAAHGLCLSYADLARRIGPERLPAAVIDLSPEETPSAIDGAHYVFGACAALAQVAVDTWTGQVRVEKMVVVTALGPVASPQGLLGQMEGGALIGQGLATTENLALRDGRYLARNFDGYLLPTLADAAATEVIAIENLPEGDRVGPRGAGEIGVNIAVPAVANAVSAAIGMPVDSLPIAPDAVLDFLERNE